MIRLIFVDNGGQEQCIEGATGDTLMQVAVDSGVEGIVGDCGGACSCATCHCYVDSEWAGKLPEPDPIEAQMIQCAVEPKESSRLSCQITLGEELDGLVVHLPASQY